MNSNTHFLQDSIQSVASTLAHTALRLRGTAARDFEGQFETLAMRPLAERIDGDGKTFLQAVVFPVWGGLPPDFLLTVPGVAPCLLIERMDGCLVAIRPLDAVAARFSPGTMLSGLLRHVEQLPQDPAAWPGLQRRIEMMTRQRIVLVDFILQADAAVFWKTYYPCGDEQLAAFLFRGLPALPTPGRKQAVKALVEFQSGHYCHALEEFILRLNPGIMTALRATGLPLTLTAYNSYLSRPPAATRNRLQAAGAVPLLGYLLSAADHRAKRLGRLIDDGQPLWPALADTLGVPEETVRWLRGKTADDISDAWLGRIPELLVSLAHLPPEKRPQCRDDWTAYTGFALELNPSAGNSQHVRWLQDIARIGWQNAHDKFAALPASPSDLRDIRDLVDEIIGAVGGELLPGVAGLWLHQRAESASWQALGQAVRDLFFDISILKQIRASLRWHQLQLQPAMAEAVDEAAPENPQTSAVQRLDRWPAPFDAPLKLGSLHAHFLTTAAELRDEGQRMEHCVGGYTQQCLFIGSSIVSLRRSDGRSVSTAELRLHQRGKQPVYELIQHRAQRNGNPPPEATQALADLMARLADAKMQPRLEQLEHELLRRQRLDESRQRWLADSPLAPHRLNALKLALRCHVGYDRFLQVGREAISHE